MPGIRVSISYYRPTLQIRTLEGNVACPAKLGGLTFSPNELDAKIHALNHYHLLVAPMPLLFKNHFIECTLHTIKFTHFKCTTR